MRRILLGLIAAMLFSSIAAAASERLPTDVRPTRMEVVLDLDPSRPDYGGTVTATLDVAKTTNLVRLHGRELTITRATIAIAGASPREARAEKISADQWTITPEQPLSPGRATLVLTFTNAFNRRAAGLYRVDTGGESYLFTQFESTEAREAFPCWDEPEFKIPWQLTLTVPDGQLAVSNTLIERESPAGAGRHTVRFHATPPLPSYLIAIAVGPLDTVSVPGCSIPTRVVCRRGACAQATEAVRATPLLLGALERYFNRRYPYEKLDLIATPEFLYGAMENAGAIVFNERRLLLDPGSASAGDRRGMRSVIAHELAHMWFGDLVTMRWWDDLWLNESFATWMAGKVMDQVFPEYRYGQSQIEGQFRGMATDSRASTGAMRQPIVSEDNLSANANELTYSKGCAVLSMFESYVGEKRFREGVLAYLKKHEWSNATGEDLWSAISSSSGENINLAMSSFLDQGGLPIVTADLLDHGQVHLQQRRFLGSGKTATGAAVWRIPVVLSWPEGGAVRTQRVWLNEDQRTVQLPFTAKPEWLLANGGARGYYIWGASPGMLYAIAADRKLLTVPERIGFVRNLVALERAGLVPVEDYLPLLREFRDDDEPLVIEATLDALTAIREPLVTPDVEPLFAGQVRQLLHPVADRIGTDAKTTELPAVTAMRPKLLLALGDLGADPEVRHWADALTEQDLDGKPMDASLAEAALPLSAQRGSAALEHRMRDRFEAATTASARGKYFSALGNFRDPKVVKELLDYTLQAQLKPQEVYTLPAELARHPGNRLLLQGWMETNYDRILQHIPSHMVARMMPIVGGCEPERVDRARTFFADSRHTFPGASMVLNRTADAASDCAHMADRDRAGFARYLRSTAGRP